MYISDDKQLNKLLSDYASHNETFSIAHRHHFEGFLADGRPIGIGGVDIFMCIERSRLNDPNYKLKIIDGKVRIKGIHDNIEFTYWDNVNDHNTYINIVNIQPDNAASLISQLIDTNIFDDMVYVRVELPVCNILSCVSSFVRKFIFSATDESATPTLSIFSSNKMTHTDLDMFRDLLCADTINGFVYDQSESGASIVVNLDELEPTAITRIRKALDWYRLHDSGYISMYIKLPMGFDKCYADKILSIVD